MRCQRIGFIAFLTLLATLGVDNCQLIQNLYFKIQNSLVLAQTPDARKAEADRLLEQGIQQYKKRENAAIQSLKQALNIYQSIQDRRGQASALEYLGKLGTGGEYDQDWLAIASEYHQRWLAIAQELKDYQMQGKALYALGEDYYHVATNLYNYTSDYDQPHDGAKAIEYFQQSLTTARQIQDYVTESNALNGLAQVYLALRDSTKAVEYLQQRLVLGQQTKNRQLEGYTLNQLREIYSRTNNHIKEIESCEQLLMLVQESNDRQSEIVATNYLSRAYYQAGNIVKAIEYSQQHLALSRAAHERSNEAIALDNLAIEYADLGNYDKALEYDQQALTISREITREIQDDSIEFRILNQLSKIYSSLGDYPKAIEYTRQVLSNVQPGSDREPVGWSALTNLGNALYKQGNFAAAEQTLFDGIKFAESRRARSRDKEVEDLDTQASVYSSLQKILIAQNKTDAALEISERGRARAFINLLDAQLNPQDLPWNRPSVESPTLQQIQQIAKAQNSTFVEYSIISDDFKVKGKQESHESELYIWVVKPNGEIAFRRTDLKPLWQQENTTLAELVLKSRQSIGAFGRGGLVAVQSDEQSRPKKLQKLHQLLIQPIADLLPTDLNSRVIFIPQNSLFLLPFPALQDKEGKYLIGQHTILTAPSIQVLEQTHQLRERIGRREGGIDSGESLVVGNPTMPSFPPILGQPPQPLPALPATEKEARTIASLLKTQPLIGNQATKSVVIQRMPSARVIHLATHGILDFKGSEGAIALAPSGTGRNLSWYEEFRRGSPLGSDHSKAQREFEQAPLRNNNGFLEDSDITSLRLKAELVVLSACDTGVGKITADGVIGLSRSFITAGVPSVVVSLWSVPDDSTAFLMTEFYKNLQRDSDKAQALRQAMLTTMKQYPNPRSWAAFTLIGEAN